MIWFLLGIQVSVSLVAVWKYGIELGFDCLVLNVQVRHG